MDAANERVQYTTVPSFFEGLLVDCLRQAMGAENLAMTISIDQKVSSNKFELPKAVVFSHIPKP